MTQSTSEPDETTTEKFRISRKEFGQIINRNLRGLQKLMRIEIADAKNVSFLIESKKNHFINIFTAILLHNSGL